MVILLIKYFPKLFPILVFYKQALCLTHFIQTTRATTTTIIFITTNHFFIQSLSSHQIYNYFRSIRGIAWNLAQREYFSNCNHTWEVRQMLIAWYPQLTLKIYCALEHFVSFKSITTLEIHSFVIIDHWATSSQPSLVHYTRLPHSPRPSFKFSRSLLSHWSYPWFSLISLLCGN